MKKKFVSILIAAVLAAAAFSLSACGGAFPKLDPKNPVRVTLWHYYQALPDTELVKLVNEFNVGDGAKAGVYVTGVSKVSVPKLSDAIRAAANKEPGAEEFPSMFTGYSDLVYEMNEKNLVAGLDSYFTEEELADFVPGFLEEGRFKDGKLKIVPFMKSTEALFLNRTDWDVFAAETDAQISELSTIEGVTEIADEYFHSNAFSGKAFFGRDALENYMISGMKQLGKDIFEETSAGIKINLENSELRRLWDNYYVPYVKGHFMGGEGFRSNDINMERIIAYVGATSSGGFFPTKVGANERQIVGETYVAPTFKNCDKYAIQQGAGVAVTKSDPKTEYACAVFLKWLNQRQNSLRFSKVTGYIPSKFSELTEKTIEETFGKNPDMSGKAFAAAAKTISECNMYTTVPFEKSTAARYILKTSMQKKAEADRKSVVGALTNGTAFDREKYAVEYFVTEQNFSAWADALRAEFKKL